MTVSSEITYVLYNIVIPILIALLTYLLVDKLGEYKKRKNYSKLGVAIINSLLEEVGSGIKIMLAAVSAAEDPSSVGLSTNTMPDKSWNGPSTIPDEVLLRIITTSANRKYEGFRPSDCRIHLKNYFGFICANYNNRVMKPGYLPDEVGHWRLVVKNYLLPPGDYIKASRAVQNMLLDAKSLLEQNTRRLFPL
jgi:hypothetical protein